MRNILSAAALVAAGCFMLPGAANAASLPDVSGLAQTQPGSLEQVHWRFYRHCHGRRWDRYCHGGRFFGGDRRRGRWYRDRDDDRRGDRRRRDRD
jgi:hypothetical protein